MKYVAITDVGKRRSKNQDQYFIGEIQNIHFLIIADGMGGHKAGEVASAIAVDTVVHEAKNTNIDPSKISTFMEKAINHANSEIYETARNNILMNGMGTTFVSAVIYKQNAYISHVGDSRAYLFRDQILKQITKDHSLINELKSRNEFFDESEDQIKHIITRSLGTEKNIKIDQQLIELNPGDYLLLCSDGLSDEVNSEEITEILKTEQTLEQLAQTLIDKALEAGGKDNITLCLMKY